MEAGTPPCTPRGRCRCREQRPSSAGSGLGAIRAQIRGAGIGPGSARRLRSCPAYRPALFPVPSFADRSSRSQERPKDLGDGSTSACPPMLSCAMFSWSPLPQSARAQPLWVRPSWGRSAPFSLALLFPLFFRGHFSLAELALPSPHSSCKRPWTTPGHPALPRLLPSLLTRRARLKQNSRPSFRGTRASPREMRGEREFWRLALSPFLGSIGA